MIAGLGNQAGRRTEEALFRNDESLDSMKPYAETKLKFILDQNLITVRFGEPFVPVFEPAAVNYTPRVRHFCAATISFS